MIPARAGPAQTPGPRAVERTPRSGADVAVETTCLSSPATRLPTTRVSGNDAVGHG